MIPGVVLAWVPYEEMRFLNDNTREVGYADEIEGFHGEASQSAVWLLDGRGWQPGKGEAMAVTSIPPRGDEIWQWHEEHRREVEDEEEANYQEKLHEYQGLEWEYLNLPIRSYPGFFDHLQLLTVFPAIESMFSWIHRVFWILSGGLLTVGLVWNLSHAEGSRRSIQSVVICLLLIVLMGVAGKGLRWADYFVYDVVDALGAIADGPTQEEESHYSQLVKVFHGIQVSLERARERIWRERDTPRSRSTSFFEPISATIGEIIDILIKGTYYIGCWVLSVVSLLVLLVLALMEQLRLFLVYVGYAATPVLIGGWTIPLLHEGVRKGIQNLLAVLCWPVGWVLCFLMGNLLAQRLVFAFQPVAWSTESAWYHPSVLAVHIWRAFHEDRHEMFLGVALGIMILAIGLLVGIWWVTRSLHRVVSGASGMALQSFSSGIRQQMFSVYSAGTYRWLARMWKSGSRNKNSGTGAVVPVSQKSPLAAAPVRSPSRAAPLRGKKNRQQPLSVAVGSKRFHTRPQGRR